MRMVESILYLRVLMMPLGNAVGSDKLKTEGAAQELKGDVQKATGDAKAAVKDAANKTADAVNKNL